MLTNPCTRRWSSASPRISSSWLITANPNRCLCEFIDLTHGLNLAGLSVPEDMDGSFFLAKGRRPELSSRNEAFGYADRFDEKYDLVRTLRKGK